jgi:hypothetical protein
MIKRGFKYIAYILFIINLSTCKVPYTPAPILASNSYLVVEGLINVSDSTYINLSRSVNVMAKNTTKPELKAIVTIESNQGSSYPLNELGKGVYATAPLNLSPANQYRLRIKASNGNIYLSDFVETKIAPPIDSIITDLKPDGLHIGINTRDPKNNTRYYRWEYAETWQFTSYFESHYTAEGAKDSPLTQSPFFVGSGVTVLPRKNDIYHCWGNAASATILLGSTSTLTQDILVNQPITFVTLSSEKLFIRYSINIKQYAVTKDAYDFWTLLKKNTESLGSIFDSQPSASIGNIHNITNPTEPVIGFISAGTLSQKRMFIDHTTIPLTYFSDYLNNTPYNGNTCATEGVSIVILDPRGKSVAQWEELDYFLANYPNALLIPVDSAKIKLDINVFPPTGGHSGSTPICVDCTLRGTNVKPAFWK